MQRLKAQISKATRRKIEAALTQEQPPWLHRRILAVHEVLSGASVIQVAQRAEVAPSSVKRWLREIRRSGISGLPRNRHLEWRRKKLGSTDLPSVQAELAAALKRRPDWRVAKRLT